VRAGVSLDTVDVCETDIRQSYLEEMAGRSGM
jgi:hypothetical protein